jgi:rhodanese-related sulfurtransferase
MSGQSYAGELLPEQAWAMLDGDPKARLVDVRTPGEWQMVGLPDLGGLHKHLLRLSWILAPGQPPNPAFVAELSQAEPDSEAPLLFLCKSGARSRAAAMAMTAAGYSRCYNVAEGFEGGRPGAGWKAKGLPWSQG